MLVLTASALVGLLERRQPWTRAVSYAAVAALTIVLVRNSIHLHAFGIWEFERRFQLAGEYVDSHFPGMRS